MTDITELAKSLKRRAASANEFGESLYVKGDDVLALVEALEKAQQRIQTHERAELTWMNALELPDDSTRNDILPAIHAEKYMLGTANKRIADLEDAEQKLCAANVTLDARAELAERQLAELESRTVTVKMPKLKMLEDYLAEVAVEERKAILLGVRMEFHRALNAEGIKWEAE